MWCTTSRKPNWAQVLVREFCDVKNYFKICTLTRKCQIQACKFIEVVLYEACCYAVACKTIYCCLL
jgi:hypothetical protein